MYPRSYQLCKNMSCALKILELQMAPSLGVIAPSVGGSRRQTMYSCLQTGFPPDRGTGWKNRVLHISARENPAGAGYKRVLSLSKGLRNRDGRRC